MLLAAEFGTGQVFWSILRGGKMGERQLADLHTAGKIDDAEHAAAKTKVIS